MQPSNLRIDSFARYPPQARLVAGSFLPILQRVPLPLLPILLREVSGYDWKFPKERRELQTQLEWLAGMPAGEFAAVTFRFRKLDLPSSSSLGDWVNDPAKYMEQLTATLWATGQMPAFRDAATLYAERKASATNQPIDVSPEPMPEDRTSPEAATANDAPPAAPTGSGATAKPSLGYAGLPTAEATPRLVLVVLAGSLGAPSAGVTLYRKLRREGLLLVRVDPIGGLGVLLQHVKTRAATYPEDYAHWIINGEEAPKIEGKAASVVAVGYDTLAPIRQRLLGGARDAMNGGRSGPEELRSILSHMTPEALGFSIVQDPVKTHFELSVLTEGSGTQIFSTTFVQWAARECLRRAQPLTLLLRFTPRQREQGMNELLAGAVPTGFDPTGSLIDADQAAWYTWLNLRRLPHTETSRFLVWQEGSTTALVIGPHLARGATSAMPLTMTQVLQLLA